MIKRSKPLNIKLDAGFEAEILQTINSSKEVAYHIDLVSVSEYTGAGYIIFDPSRLVMVLIGLVVGEMVVC